MASTLPELTDINQSVALKTLSKNGTPPKSRLDDPRKTQSFVSLIQQADAERDRKVAMLKGMADGHPPYNPSKRRAASQAWRANFSSLEGKAYLSNGLVPYYDLFSSSKYLIDFQTGYGSPNQQAEWSRIITEELDTTIKQWEGFEYEMQPMLHDFVGYGKGFLAWNNTYDWHFEHVPHLSVKVMDGTKINLGKLEIIVIPQSYYVHELWAKIKNEVVARAAGWYPEAVKQAIRDAVPKRPNSTEPPSWEMVQQELKDHDLLESCRSSTVQAARVYVREFDGKITELMVPTTMGKADFLFKKRGRYSNFRQVFAPFFLEVGDGSWHGANGLLKDIFNLVQTKDRLNCAITDAAFLRTAITLQAKSATSMSKIGLVQIGAFNVIPPDFDVQQSQILGDITTALAVNADMDQRLSRNTGIYRPSPEKKPGNPITAEQARLEFTASTILGNSAVSRFYNQLDPAWGELARRITNPNLSRTDESSIAALDFQERCFKRGVPQVALLSRKSVRAFRSIGNGSMIMRQQTLASLAPYSSRWPESGQQNYDDDVIAANAGHSKVERYNPKSERLGQPTDQQAYAMLENAAMKVGAEVIWTDTQNNLIHAETHLKADADAAASLTQGGNPVEVLAFMEISGPHIAIHLQHLSQDPSHQRQYKALEAEYKRLGQVADKLHAQVQKMMQEQQANASKIQQAQAIAQGTDGDTAIKAATAQAKIQQSNIKTQVSLRQKEEKHQQQMTQAAQDMAIKDAQAAAQIAIDQAKAQAKTTSE